MPHGLQPTASRGRLKRGGDADEFSRPGFYTGIGATWGIYTRDESAFNIQLDDLGYVGQSEGTDDTFGDEFYIGYRTSEWIAVEAQVEYLAPATIEVEGSNIVDITGYSATLAGKFFPIGGRMQPRVVPGAGYLEIKASDQIGPGSSKQHEEGLVGRFGRGVDYYLTRMLALNLSVDYLLPIGELHDADQLTVSLGALVRF